ncbi:MAG TPA: hypothetical protein VLT91_06900 [Rhizomicrobium sp.]|nr:hypothetical protein [Rhizomicrobium sp.]
MRSLILFCLALIAAATFGREVHATPLYPKGALALEAQLLANQTADAKVWIKDEAMQEATGQFLSDETARNAARKFGASGSDVSTLAFLVLMEAARAADANVYKLVNGVQAAGASRVDQRQAALASNGIASAQQSQLSGGLQSAQQNQGNAFVPLASTAGGNPVRDARNASAVIPPPSMNLQDAMDRESRIEDLLATAMKRVNPN